MKISFLCKYCGHSWLKTFWSKPVLDDIECEKCKDSDISIKEYEEIDYYATSLQPTKKIKK